MNGKFILITAQYRNVKGQNVKEITWTESVPVADVNSSINHILMDEIRKYAAFVDQSIRSDKHLSRWMKQFC